MDVVIPEDARLLLLEVIRAGQLDAGDLHLYQSDIEPGPFTVEADLVECNFTGYAALPIAVWGEVFKNGSGGGRTVGPSQQFNHGIVGVENQVFGWYYTNTAGDLLFARRLPNAPVTLTGPTDSLVILPALDYPE